ncbi:MAG TPA: hypothetical protein VLF66_06640 [Thermoanaerobaculia bacterium]|nr:hypothetical protein [Thermoanaerobaculia bacterium]
MTREDLIAFVNRDRAAVNDLDSEYLRERKRAMGASEALRIGDQLRLHVTSLRPDWPREEDRAEDREAHRRLSTRLRSVHGR